MKLKNVTRRTTLLALSLTLILPHMPGRAFAAPESGLTTFFDLFPEDSDAKKDGTKNQDANKQDAPKKDDTGLFPLLPGTGSGKTTPRTTPGTSQGAAKSGTTNGLSMSTAKVADAYACPIFDNRPHAELIEAIDSLSTAVSASPDCEKTTSAKSIEDNNKAIKESITALSGVLEADPTTVNASMIDSNVTTALTAINNLGNVLNSNAFLNSACGRQSMSTGKALLAFNDMVNGFAPYALFAVAANAALAPMLPIVIGGTIVTTGISVISKMIDQNTLDMTKPEHRKAVVQNTCQYIKVAKKVRFMQLAQSGKIEKISQELEHNIVLYKSGMSRPSTELTSLLAYRQKVSSTLTTMESQLKSDKNDMDAVNAQLKINSDDLMVCTLARELVNWGADGKTFPMSAFNNLEAAAAQGERSLKLQSLTLKSLNNTSMQRIVEAADQSGASEASLKVCAQMGKTWITAMNQAIALTSNSITGNKVSLENELSENSEYRQFKSQYAKIQMDQITIKRVEKAMQELAKDTSIIDRSELDQRMVLLKNTLFGAKKIWGLGTPPVLAWINHTKKMHDQSISGFITSVGAVRAGSFSLTSAGRGEVVVKPNYGSPYMDARKQVEDGKISANLGTITLQALPAGSRENEIVCQQLESAWLDWTAAMNHLGAIQLFCDMIDGVLDPKMDGTLMQACRGSIQLNGTVNALSMTNLARQSLTKNGFAAQATLVEKKMKELQCPTPAVSVMND